ncbi:MAG: fatty acid desaturase [Anaerolineales bacterium]|uniref:Fatty acid desaturase n=1 Tax=Candidatus Desulfolinea nitratireducens TaxID=2841698 RepID=A0A8J6TI36_9CHLR|nr:fatty acid desaturase [Candidatus Desulfolinea nitratireducens]MBL6961050.1 fatty acid desaturase [Anaerolineales bacterium]
MKVSHYEGVDWRKIVSKYQVADTWRSVWQIVNTLVPYFILWGIMFWSVGISYWLTLLISIPTAGFMVRTFIIFHDCGHGSFFKSKRVNTAVGIITGILVFTPWYRWWHEHAIHHATAGNLDKRGTGDVDTWTVEEYLAAPFFKRLWYRIMRQPLVMFTIGAMIVFAVVQRIPLQSHGKRERASIWWTNLALVVLISGLIALVGWKTYLLVQLPVLLLGTSGGVWMFYVQHNYEGSYWERQEKWDFYKAAMNGSSLYELPAILQWFTGNIGFHHIHHLGPRIPNYKLQECLKENPVFQVKSLNMWSSLKTLRLRLWDEATQQMVGWERLKKYRQRSYEA